jgi:hypothetical protein
MRSFLIQRRSNENAARAQAAISFHLLVWGLAVAFLLPACRESLRSSFPTENEVRNKLHRGMTAEQVFAAFGKPDGHQFIKFEIGGKLHYIAPPATRTAPQEGYAGFTVLFVKDQVWDWEVIRMKPSYEPRLLGAKQNRWGLALVILLFLGTIAATLVRIAWLRRQRTLEEGS